MDDNTVVDMHLARMLSLVCSSFQIPGSKASVPVDFLDSLSWVSRTLLLSILKHPLPSPFYLCRAVLGPSAHLPPPVLFLLAQQGKDSSNGHKQLPPASNDPSDPALAPVSSHRPK